MKSNHLVVAQHRGWAGEGSRSQHKEVVTSAGKGKCSKFCSVVTIVVKMEGNIGGSTKDSWQNSDHFFICDYGFYFNKKIKIDSMSTWLVLNKCVSFSIYNYNIFIKF